MLSKLYDALRAGGAPEDKAREAAEEVASYELLKQDTQLLKWMVGILTALVLGAFWMQWQTLAAISDMDARLGNLESGFQELRERTSGIERRLHGFEQRLPRS